jgi:hypothetical protein
MRRAYINTMAEEEPEIDFSKKKKARVPIAP